MNINFTGIKNIGYCNASFNDEAFRILQSSGEDEFDYESQTQEEEEDDAYYPLYQKQEGHTLNIQLTDDFNGKHLSEFKKALKNSHLPYADYINPINSNFLNIYLTDDIIEDDDGEFKDNVLYVNDLEVELKDKTLPIFSYIAKLVSEIARKPKEEFVVNKDYFDSDYAKEGIVFGDNMEDIYKEDYLEVMEDIHDPQHVKNGANKMKNVIMEFMSKYFEN